VWARLGIDGHQVNHKRVYCVMRDEGLLLFRQGHKPIDTRKHESFVKTFKRDYAKLAHRPDSQTVMGQLKA